jgi:hypothetical protein
MKEEGMRGRVKRTGHLAHKVEKLFKLMLNRVLGDSFKKEFIRTKNPKKKDALNNSK